MPPDISERMEKIMKIAAIIAEYNPLHNGHSYHIQETKRQTGAEWVLVLMSGSFVQRGEPAVYDKYIRTFLALKSGADMVLELPSVSACGSAEYFAEGAVALLDSLDCVDHLSFGCETDSLEDILQAVSVLEQESTDFKAALRESLRAGNHFAAARDAAIMAAVSQSAGTDASKSFPVRLLSSPNAILAIQYCTALQRRSSSIHPVLIPRLGSGYLDPDLAPSAFSSAMAIRRSLSHGRPLPPQAVHLPLYQEAAERFPHALDPIFPDDASVLLNQRIQQLHPKDRFWDLSPELVSRIIKNRREFHTWTQWCQLLKTKQYTYSRISRALTHLLLNMTEEIPSLRHDTPAPYARILGLRKGSVLPSVIRSHTTIPLIAKLPDFMKKEPDCSAAKKQLALDLSSRDLYRLLYWQKYHITLPDDYAAGPIIV